MKIRQKLKYYLCLCVKIAIDAIFLAFWVYIVYAIHVKLLPILGLTGLAGVVINFVAILFDSVTGAVVIAISIKDLWDELNEIFKKK